MQTMKLSELVLDFSFYPRQQVDSTHVAAIVEAIKAGVELPPMLADQKSKRVTDGFHRHRGYGRVDGPDAEVPVILKRYKNEAEMFLDAVRMNANHGKNLSPFDRAHVIILADKLKIATPKLADAMSVTKEKIASLVEKKTALSGNGKSVRVALKATVGHMAGKKLTKGQSEANERLGGMQQLHYVNQLILLVKNDLLDMSNEELLVGLRELHTLLDGVLV